MISVKNSSGNTIEVAINHWGKGGNTSAFKIERFGSDEWDRNDWRGFVMIVIRSGISVPYYVYCDSNIEVFDDHVTDNSQNIGPVNRREIPLNKGAEDK
jgi:hypothetical protein